MSIRSTPTFRNHLQAFRAGALLFLMLCLLISCPLKRELKSILLEDAPAGQPVSVAQQPKAAVANLSPAENLLDCARTVLSILEEVEPGSLFQHFDFKNPVFWLAVSLAALYLVALAGSGKSLLPIACCGGALTAKVPLFLRHRQLII